jgi:CRP-like cAMP-binding protein
MEERSKLWYLEHFDLFDKMSEPDIRSIEQSAYMRTLKKNEVLRFPQQLHQYVYLLKEGFLKMCVMNEDGREFIKYLVKPGNLFGEIPLLGDYESGDEYAEALEDSFICFLDAEKLKRWMQNNADLRIKIYKQISNRLKKVENRLASMIFKDARTRIQEFIIDFAMEYGKPSGNSFEVKNILTHDDIAKLTATSRQTVSTVLNEMREQKLIDYDNKTMRVFFSSVLPLN